MRTETQEKFKRIIKEGFQEILKPLGFKKKAYNFYLQLEGLGQIINIQKSKWSTKEEIHYTINTGIFVPEYWSIVYNYQNEEIPKFPTEPICLVRKRIGEIRNQNDTWFELKKETNEDELIQKMRSNIDCFILPYFESINTKQKFLEKIETGEIWIPGLSKLIVYAELKKIDKAKIEYKKLLNEKNNPHHLANVKEYGKQYKLE